MQNQQVQTGNPKVITGTVRLSYVHLLQPQITETGEERYSVSILIPKTDQTTIDKINAAIKEALNRAPWKGKVANPKLPLRDGDLERPDDPAYAGHYFLNAASRTKPGVAKPIGRGPDGKMKFEEITDSREIYSGCYAKVSITFYPFDKSGNRGIAVGINNVVKVQDGEYLGGRARLEDEFANEDFDVAVEEEDFLN